MSYTRILICAPLANRLIIRYLSALAQTKNVLSCGLNMAHKKIKGAIHGPTCYEVTKDLDLSEKTCLITGANSGIGLEMTRCLSARGCRVLMACRNKYAAGAVAKAACDDASRLRFYQTNLASFRSVIKCCDNLLANETKLDIVILNAAVFGLPWTLTEDMLETTFQVNYLSQFHLLMNVEKILAPDARVVFVSSESHRNINMSIRDKMIPSEETVSLPSQEYTAIRAYNISKLCGLLAMHYLGYRWMKSSIQVFAAHPGSFVKTRLCRNWWPYEALYNSMLPFSKTISQAASTPLYCATSPDLDGLSALYFKDLKRCEESELAKDFHLAFRMNDLTRELLKERTEVLAIDDGKVEDRTICPTPKDSIHDALTPEYSA